MNFEKYLKSDSSLLRDIIVVASIAIPNTSTYLLAIDFYHPNLPVKWLEGETKKEGVTMAEHALNRFTFH